MAATLLAARQLPDGRMARLLPFHISLEGVKDNVICRDDVDCDSMVKCMAVCAHRKNVIIVIYAVVSNHGHIAILAENWECAKAFGEEVKRVYAQRFQRKYGERGLLAGTVIDIQAIDSLGYLRNVLAYVPRNAMDNGAVNIQSYKWTGFNAMFCQGEPYSSSTVSGNNRLRAVSSLSKRETERILHTGDKLSNVRWLIDSNEELVPSSFCDWWYLEDVFNHSQSFYYRLIGSVNLAEMNQSLVSNHRERKTDEEFLKTCSEYCNKWFNKTIYNLSLEEKSRIIPFIFRSFRTTPAQIARTFQLPLDKVLQFTTPSIAHKKTVD